MLHDFKQFIMRGNVLDLAVGVIIGAAFGKIVTSLVNDVIMPPIGLVIGNVDFSSLFLTLGSKTFATLAEAKAAGAATINYGVFLNAVLEFLIIAFAVFMMIRQVNRLLPKPVAPKATKDCSFCCIAIPIPARRCPHCTSELKTA